MVLAQVWIITAWVWRKLIVCSFEAVCTRWSRMANCSRIKTPILVWKVLTFLVKHCLLNKRITEKTMETIQTISQDGYRKQTCKKIFLFIRRKRWNCPILYIYTKVLIHQTIYILFRLPPQASWDIPILPSKTPYMSKQSPQENRRVCSKLSMIGKYNKTTR